MLENTQLSQKASLQDLSSLELAQALAGRLAIPHKDWHRLKGDRKAQAAQQLASALVFLLKEQPESALSHTNQAQGWLNRSLKAPPCPDHNQPKIKK
ncbi:MAG: DUF6439 family protein [Xenococcus sp. MO_188.B8]|nr:DUF6439 family protein [Xenococcus sp. MO_188.B8]